MAAVLFRALFYLVGMFEASAFLFDKIGAEDKPYWMQFMPSTDNPLDWGVIEPDGDLFLPVEKDLELNCSLTGYVTSVNASQLFFKHKQTNKPDHDTVPRQNIRVLGQRKIGLKIPNVTQIHSGWYYCLLDESSIGKNANQPITSKSVIITAPPRRITNMTCISRNFEDMTCDWCSQAEPGVIYELHWRIGKNVANGTCQHYPKDGLARGKCQCRFCASKQEEECKNQTFHQRVKYVMTVFSRKPVHETVQSDIEVEAAFDKIVKPDPVRSMSAESNSSSILVSWKPPEGLDDANTFPLDYTVTFTSSWHPSPTVSITSNEWMVVSGLHPYTMYNVSVSCRPRDMGGYASDVVWLLADTLKDVPSRGPVCMPGSFRRTEQGAIIYWGVIAEEHMNGVLEGYTVTYGVEGSDVDIIHTSHIYSIVLILDSNRDYTVSVAGRTAIGEGIYSQIYVPNLEFSQGIMPRHVEGEVTEDERKVVFTVVPPNGVIIDNYTLLYCIGGMRHGVLDMTACKDGSAAKAMIYPGNSSELIYTEHEEDNVYGVAINVNHTSSGLSPVWTCLYHYNGDPGQPKLELQDKQVERSVAVLWQHLTCSSTIRGHVTHYYVQVYLNYQLVQNKSIGAVYSDRQMVYLADNLDAYTEYDIVVAACTTTRCGAEANVSVTTLQSAPGGPPENVQTNSNLTHLMMKWQPPLLPNGIISHYNIVVKNVASGEEIQTFSTSTERVVSGLAGFVNYSTELRAVNGGGISPVSDPVYEQMPIRAPDAVKFDMEIISDSSVEVKNIRWPPHSAANGPKTIFILQSVTDAAERNYTIDGNGTVLEEECTGKAQTINVSIIAVNKHNGVDLEGRRSDVISKTLCHSDTATNQKKSQTDSVLIGVLVSVLVVVVIAVPLLVWKFSCGDDKSTDEKVIMPPDNEAGLHVTVTPVATITDDGYSHVRNKAGSESSDDSGVSDPTPTSTPTGSFNTEHGPLYDTGSQIYTGEQPEVIPMTSNISDYAQTTMVAIEMQHFRSNTSSGQGSDAPSTDKISTETCLHHTCPQRQGPTISAEIILADIPYYDDWDIETSGSWSAPKVSVERESDYLKGKNKLVDHSPPKESPKDHRKVMCGMDYSGSFDKVSEGDGYRNGQKTFIKSDQTNTPVEQLQVSENQVSPNKKISDNDIVSDDTNGSIYSLSSQQDDISEYDVQVLTDLTVPDSEREITC